MARKQVAHGLNNGSGDGSVKSARSRGKKPDKTDSPKSNGFKISNYCSNWMIVVIILAAIIGWLHGLHIWTLFEGDRHFSHLSTLERDLAFRTEMGLYYSYYKTMIEATSSLSGFQKLVFDNVTEYPSTINVLKRFNLYPEVVLGITYRLFMSFTSAMKIQTKVCWQINRGDLPPITSCEGIGDAHYFYTTGVFFLNSLMLSVIFLNGCYLSGSSIFGGVITVAFYFFNHGEATRVMWTPPLRESYSFPFLILEILLVTHMLKTRKPNYYLHTISIGIAAYLFMLPWQFAQFALLTQSACVFGLYMLEYIGSWKINIVLHAQMYALLANYVVQFGNEMLLTSFYAASLLVLLAIVRYEGRIESIVTNLIGRCFVKGIIWLIGTFTIKKTVATLLQSADDAHVWEIFKSKFTDFNNFHTMLYTCAKEFDFLEMETVLKLCQTMLIPCMIVITFAVFVKVLYYEYQLLKKPTAADDADEDATMHREKPHPEIVYSVLQMLAFTFMAVLIMRLKLFMTPMMCITASLLANRKLFGAVLPGYRLNTAIVLVLAIACVSGGKNLVGQWNTIGEFENWPHEQLLNFINEKIPETAVFAGAMPTMASIKLSCQRPIVNHPHYEDAGLRARTMRVYSMYSRRTLEQVRATLEDMQVDYFVLENSWCVRVPKQGCQMPQIWDLEEPENAGKRPACAVARDNPEPHFREVYKNNVYTVLKVNKTKRKKSENS